MNNSDSQPVDGGASSLDSWGSEPLCSFDPETGFAINESTVDELCWYTYLSPDQLDDESLLESRNDD